MHSVGGVFGRVQGLFLLDVIEHLGRRFAARRVEELIGQAVDNMFLAGLLDDVCRRDEGHGTGRGGSTQAGTQLTGGIRRQQVTVHIAGTTAHGGAGHDVLRHCVLQEAFRCVDFYLASLDVFFIDHTAHTTIVVNVTVGVDHRDHWLFRTVLEIQIKRSFGRFGGNQRVEDGDTFLAFDNGHVRQVVVAHLVDAIGNFEQARDVDQLRLTPQAGVSGVWCDLAFLDECILGGVPDHIA
ncbi:hypothetical protein D3C81_680110 [compost metagenome]